MANLNILLLVEDDENDIIFTTRKIERANLKYKELLIARSLEQAINFLKTKDIQVVLLDLNLLDSKGLDTIKAIKKVYDGGIVVVITSIDDENIGVESVQEGADDYIVKSNLTEQGLRNAILFSMARKTRWDRISKMHSDIDKALEIIEKR